MKGSKQLRRTLALLLSVAMSFPLSAAPVLAADVAEEVAGEEQEIETAAYTGDTLLSAGLHVEEEHSTTTDQPFPAMAGGSQRFRIPAIITLNNGWLMAAADARYGTTSDGGGLDTIVSISKDDGKTWENSLPLYFPDSVGITGQSATTIIDPILIQGADDTIYLMADVNPTGNTTLYGKPGIQRDKTTKEVIGINGTGTGYAEVGDTQRLVLTEDYSKTTIRPTKEDLESYPYYVGDLKDGYAPVLNRSDNSATQWVVDECYNIYELKGGTPTPLTQKQVNTATDIHQNVFYQGSKLHVYQTGYMWLATSKDNGATWSHKILNPEIKHDNEVILLVSPGRGLVCKDGTIVIGFYKNGNVDLDKVNTVTDNTERATFIFSKDNGKTWKRIGDIPGTTSSENEMVELEDGTIRMFVRSNSGVNKVVYKDAVWNEQKQTYEWTEGNIVQTNAACWSSCNCTAIKYSQKIDGKDAILVSYPGGPGGRFNGRIWTFLVEKDNSMNLAYTYEVNDIGYAYSCLTELQNGMVGLLYENRGGDGTIDYDYYDIRDVAKGAVIGDRRELDVPLYDTYTEMISGGFTPEPMPDEDIVEINSETQSGTVAYRGSSVDDQVFLENALYTITKSGENYAISGVTAEGTTVHVGLQNGKAGCPQSAGNDAVVTLTQQGENIQLSSSSSGYSGTLCFTNGRFDQMRTVSNDNVATTYLKLYRAAAENETGSTEVPGYVALKSLNEIVSGNKYLIAAASAGADYVLYPSNDGSNALMHFAKVGDRQTLTKVSYTGKANGTVSFKNTADNVRYVVNVAGRSVKKVYLKAGEKKKIGVEEACEITHQPDSLIATAVVAENTGEITWDTSTAFRGSNAEFDGEPVELSKALYTLAAGTAAGTFTASAQTDNGTKVYLNMQSAGYPSKTAQGDLTFTQNNDGTFYIYTNASKEYLYFHRDGQNRFNQQTVTGTGNETKFQIYRPAEGNEAASEEVPGYVKVTQASGLTAGKKYLIIAEYAGNHYALYPSDSTNNYYAHVVRVNTGNSFMEITAVNSGVTDIMLSSGSLYRVYVGEKQDVTLDANGGRLKEGSVTLVPGTTVDYLPEAVKKGSIFDGWYDASGKEVKVGDVYESSGPLTAKWGTEPEETDFQTLSGRFDKYEKRLGDETLKDFYTEESWNAYQAELANVRGLLQAHSDEIDEKISKERLGRAYDKLNEFRERLLVPKNPAANFVDAQEGWFVDVVAKANQLYLMKGKTDTTFEPAKQINRAEVAIVLYRMAGKEEPQTTPEQFNDMQGWYQDALEAVAWASVAKTADMEKAIVTGYTNEGKFKPGNDITRQEMAQMLYRYAQYRGYADALESDPDAIPWDSFEDKDSPYIYDSGRKALKWCVEHKIIGGKNQVVDGKTLYYLDPQGKTIRAEAAKMLVVLADMFEN